MLEGGVQHKQALFVASGTGKQPESHFHVGSGHDCPDLWMSVVSNRNNLLVIEFKKKNAETYDKENDRNKLMYLTDQKEDFKYNFGLFVELGSHEVYMEVYQEGNLQTKLNYSITY